MSIDGASNGAARRILSLWLPSLPTDRLVRRRPELRGKALATVIAEGGRHLVAINREAEEEGLAPGMTVVDSRALKPGLVLLPVDPVDDRRALSGLASWCGRYTPWTAMGRDDGCGAGLWLDITGCAHLWGGEAALMADLIARLTQAGYQAKAAAADTPGAAWAWARFATAPHSAAASLPGGSEKAALAPLPAAALRLDAASLVTLDGLGLRRIGDLYDLPRAALGARLGKQVLRRLDQALGRIAEPISPMQPILPYRALRHFVEPLIESAGIAAALRQLLEELSMRLSEDHLGVRRLRLVACRNDATGTEIEVGTHGPSRAVDHLFRLFSERLPGIDPGFGIETLALSAPAVEALPAQQASLAMARAAPRPNVLDLTQLLDLVGARLGGSRLARLEPRASHVPERAALRIPAHRPSAASWPIARPRPLRLLASPEPVIATAPVPDDPPLLFRWRKRVHHVVWAEGPERIAPEWWRDGEPTRDYYRVEDKDGRRFWLYRSGLFGVDTPPRWFLHGIFA